jgi:hypothetical protein
MGVFILWLGYDVDHWSDWSVFDMIDELELLGLKQWENKIPAQWAHCLRGKITKVTRFSEQT